MPRKPDSISITSANEPLSQDQARRTKVYLFQMGTRVSCFVAAIFIPGPFRWVLVTMAVILPYIAVVKVNLGRANNLNMDNPMEYLQLEAERARFQGTPTLPTESNSEPDPASYNVRPDPRGDPRGAPDFDPHDDLETDSQEPHHG